MHVLDSEEESETWTFVLVRSTKNLVRGLTCREEQEE